MKWLGASAAAIGMSEMELAKIAQVLANNDAGAPVVYWVNAGVCGGCSTSALHMYASGSVPITGQNFDCTSSNRTIYCGSSIYPSGSPPTGYVPVYDGYPNDPGGGGAIGPPVAGVAPNAVLDVLPNSTSVEDVLIEVLNVKSNSVVMGPAGEDAASVYTDVFSDKRGAHGDYVVVVEGAVLPDEYCSIGRNDTDTDPQTGNPFGEIGVETALKRMIEDDGTYRGAIAVLAIGTCATFGGIPAAAQMKDDGHPTSYEETGAMSTEQLMDKWGLKSGGALGSRPLINVSCCPVHPNAFLLTVVDFILNVVYGAGLPSGFLMSDGSLRPTQYFGTCVHINCERFASYKQGFYATNFGDSRTATIGGVPGQKPCLYNLGCRGIDSNAPCSRYPWNTGVANTYCPKAGMNCIGCSEPGFPDSTLRTVY